MKTRAFLFSILWFLLTGPSFLSAQVDTTARDTTDDKPSLLEYLISLEDDVLEVTLEADLEHLVKHRYDEEYQDGYWSFRNPAGDTVRWHVQLRPRGNARREICLYPPVKIKFDKDDLREAGLRRKHNSFKMVNQCKLSDMDEQYLLRELLAYRLYNLVSPNSFHTRLLHLTYLDSGRRDKPFEMYAFLIEDDEELADRFGGVVVDRERFSNNMLQAEAFQLMSLYQYMIGNTDWAVGNLHNLQLFKLPEFEKVIAVPYDFDYAGLVDASYAVPTEGLPIKTVTQRYYRGPACSEEEVERLRQHFLDREADIMQLVENFPGFDRQSQRYVIAYMESFFKQLKHPRSIESIMGQN